MPYQTLICPRQHAFLAQVWKVYRERPCPECGEVVVASSFGTRKQYEEARLAPQAITQHAAHLC